MQEAAKPFFSIVTPAYNRADLLPATMNSVLAQTFTNWEFIIIDDASTDETEQIVKSFNDRRIFYLKNETNKERGFSRNKGIDNAKGLYVCFLDSDDLWEPDHLDNFYQHVVQKNTPVALLFSNIYLEAPPDRKEKRESVSLSGNVNLFSYLLRYTFNPTRVCLHHKILKRHRFDTTIPGIEDLDLWLHIAKDSPIIQLPEYTCTYILHENSYTLGDSKRFEKELQNFKIVFAKESLKNLLPLKDRYYLLSKCHYFLSIKHEQSKQLLKMYACIIKAFMYYPRGYNNNANKTMVVMALYNIPFAGMILRGLIRLFKKRDL